MEEKAIAIIHIYRCPEEEYHKERCEKELKLEEYFSNVGNTVNNPDIVMELTSDEIQRSWKSWQYNEVIGFIKIFTSGNQLRGESYMVKQKSIRKNIKNKIFVFKGKEFELTIKKSETNRNISNILINRLKKLEKEDYKNRYVDLTEITNVAEHLNWKGLLF